MSEDASADDLDPRRMSANERLLHQVNQHSKHKAELAAAGQPGIDQYEWTMNPSTLEALLFAVSPEATVAQVKLIIERTSEEAPIQLMGRPIRPIDAMPAGQIHMRRITEPV